MEGTEVVAAFTAEGSLAFPRLLLRRSKAVLCCSFLGWLRAPPPSDPQLKVPRCPHSAGM